MLKGNRSRGRLLVAAAVAALAAGFAATGVRAEDAVKLQFWDMVWGPPEYIDTAKALVAEFNKENPSIQVEYRSVPWNNWYQTYVTAIGSGTAPDLSTGAGYQAVQLYDLGAIRPIDDFIDQLKADGEINDFLPNTIDTLRYDNHYVALPWGIDIRVWYYRKDLLQAAGQEVPKTWADLRAAAKATTTNGKYGILAAGDTGGSHYIYNAILNNGGGLFTKDRKLDLRSDRNVEAINMLADMVADGSVSPASVGYTSEDKRTAFNRGDGAFTLDTPGLIDQAGDAKDKIGIVPPLAGPHGDKATIFWINNIMLYKQSKHPKETMVFLKWWSKNQLPLWTKGNCGQLPTRMSLASDPYFKDNANRAYIIDNYVPVGKTTATHAAGIFPALNEVEGEGVMQTMAQQLWGGQDVPSILDTAEPRLKAIVKE